ncbi:hypothetical protein ADUPG1_009165 [Aduncisulcus paluster]|uniref:Uncharacterized protein n=1 Tax=Aduncisulcus paluster TaxID=2918883 RepID=A0ABQ5KYK8_9EUKA|nr:hypothetical protein ADUPG1_009165 [Aduncisulcus paluster]
MVLPGATFKTTLTKQGIYDLVVVGLKPPTVALINDLQIDDISVDFDAGIGKGEITFENIAVDSFTFWPTEDIVLSFIPSSHSLFATMGGAGLVMSLDYSLKLLTFPYSSASGSAMITVQDLSATGTAVWETKPDTSDHRCGDDDGCGYVYWLTLNGLKFSIGEFSIDFLGYVDPIIATLTNFLTTTLTPIITELLSNTFQEAVDEALDSPMSGIGYNFPTHNHTYFYSSAAGDVTISDDFMVLTNFSTHTQKLSNKHDVPEYPKYFLNPLTLEDDPFYYPTMPDILAGNDVSVFLTPAVLTNDLYQQFVIDRLWWSKRNEFFASKYKTVCVGERLGCGQRKQYERIDPTSVIFEADTYTSLGIPELLDCAGCDLEVDWAFFDLDLPPVVPVITSIAADGFSIEYDSVVINLRGLNSDDGTLVFAKSFIATMNFKGILISDHVYLNLVQAFSSLDNFAYFDNPNNPTTTTNNDDDLSKYSVLISITSAFYLDALFKNYFYDNFACLDNFAYFDNPNNPTTTTNNDDDLSKYSVLISITSAFYLDALFKNYFYDNFAWFLSIPLGYDISCLLKDEEMYYSASDAWISVSTNISQCCCNLGHWKDDSDRQDDGTFICTIDL